MLNLLPKDHRKRVRREYIRRFFIVALLLFSFVVVAWGTVFFPVYISTQANKNIVENNLTNIKTSSVGKDKTIVLKGIKDLEVKMKLISAVPGERVLEYVSKATELKASGISISSISYIKKDASHKQIILEGVASSRNVLISFFKKAKQVSWATASDVPLSSLAGEKNIPFTMNLDITSSQ